MTTAQNSPFVNEAVYWPIQLLNTVNDFLQRHVGVAPLKLNRKNLAKLTRVERVHDAFGSQEQFHQLFAAFFDEFAGNPQLSAMAILGIMNWATSCFRARKECMEYVAAHPEVLKQQIEKPLVIMGMHRTGSTLLFNLMHQDETTRCAFMYEMAGDWPHLPAATSRAAHYTDCRMALLKRLLTLGRKILPEGMAKKDRARETTHDMIEEENLIASHQMCWFAHAPLVGNRFKELLHAPDKDFVFAYIKIYLQMLQTGYVPASHWTLKSPSHLLHMDSFMDTFPDARVVFLHRDPESTVPSMCYLLEAIFGSYWKRDTWDRRTLGPYVCELYRLMLQRMMKYRDSHAEKAQQFLDIKFSDLEADPIGQVRRIYQKFGIIYDESMTAKMQLYLTANQKHKHGKPDYTLEKYGVTAATIRTLFAEYSARYL